MNRTVTALYDSRSEAETARQRLTQSNIDAERVQIIDQSSTSYSPSRSGSEGGGGFWASVKGAFMPHEDRHAYEEGMRRGGYLLCAQVDEHEADEAVRLLEESNCVDFDQRQESWKSEGWTPYSGGMGSTGTTSAGSTSGHYEGRAERIVEEEHIPIVEEQLHVGKREVHRGGARVRSYIREIPVHEQINLREEHVSVERRPVDQRVAAGEGLADGDLLRERDIEMTETEEIPMVSKEARVAEELVVRKTATEHVENIDDTVRRTEIEVDEGASGDRSAFFNRENDRPSETGRTDGKRIPADRDR